MELFKIYKFSKLFILYVKHSTCETLHRNVVIFAWKTFNIPITWLIFHDFGMIVVLLVQRNQSIKAKVDKKEKKNQIDDFMQRSVQQIPPFRILEKTNNSSQIASL